jgi:hypothetical protein
VISPFVAEQDGHCVILVRCEDSSGRLPGQVVPVAYVEAIHLVEEPQRGQGVVRTQRVRRAG